MIAPRRSHRNTKHVSSIQDAIARQKCLIVPAFNQLRMGKAQHQGRIDVRAYRQPVSVEQVCGIAAHGTDVHALDPRPGGVAAASRGSDRTRPVHG
jgi:hypothetical protein